MWWWKQRLDCCTLKMQEGTTSQGIQKTTKSLKGKGNDSSLKASRRDQPCWYLDFNPMKLDLRLLASIMIRMNLCYFTSLFVVICYSSHRKLTLSLTLRSILISPSLNSYWIWRYNIAFKTPQSLFPHPSVRPLGHRLFLCLFGFSVGTMSNLEPARWKG